MDAEADIEAMQNFQEESDNDVGIDNDNYLVVK